MTLHPQATEFLRALKEQNAPAWPDLTPIEGREIFSGLTDLFGTGPELFQVEDRSLNGVRVRFYRPADTQQLPVMLYMHGGGWVLGDLDSHDALCRHLASRSECVVVSIDYSRSPETKFPGAIEDCLKVLNHVADHATQLKVDRERMVVAGDSAGGNLATAVAMSVRNDEGPRIRQQVLIYPVLDRRCETDSFRQFAEGYGLSEPTMQWFWGQYLADDKDGANELASPLRSNELSGLAPAHIITAEYDVLRDEGEQYARRLKDAAVPTTHRRYDGMLHGFVHFSGVFDDGLSAIDDIAQVVRVACKA